MNTRRNSLIYFHCSVARKWLIEFVEWILSVPQIVYVSPNYPLHFSRIHYLHLTVQEIGPHGEAGSYLKVLHLLNVRIWRKPTVCEFSISVHVHWAAPTADSSSKGGCLQRMLWVRASYRELHGIKAVYVGKRSSRIFWQGIQSK